jgi:hypothetical protein
MLRTTKYLKKKPTGSHLAFQPIKGHLAHRLKLLSYIGGLILQKNGSSPCALKTATLYFVRSNSAPSPVQRKISTNESSSLTKPILTIHRILNVNA